MAGGLKCQAKVDGFPGLTCPNWSCENFEVNFSLPFVPRMKWEMTVVCNQEYVNMALNVQTNHKAY